MIVAGKYWVGRDGALVCVKFKYASEHDAKKALKKQHYLGMKAAYLCACGSWHLTRQRKRK